MDKMKLAFEIIKFVLWIIPELLGLVEKASHKWPKRPKETEKEAEERRDNRRAFVDPRVKNVLTAQLGREPKPAEVEAVRELAYSANKKLRKSGKARA